MAAMQEIWKRIEAGFETIQASALWEQFQPGATDAAIQEAEAVLGITLPEEVRASYRIHQGSHRYGLIGVDEILYELYSLAEMVDVWQQEVSRDLPPDWMQ